MTETPCHTKRRLQVSVRNLVDFSLRCGDLMHEFTGANRATEAVRIHQKIQRSRPEGYRAEVAVSREIETSAFFLTVSGRADGVYESAEVLKIEEIKTTTADLSRITDSDHPLHWGQVKCYGAMLGAEKEATRVDLQLVYANLDSGDTRLFELRIEYDALEVFFNDLVKRYLDRAAMVVGWQQARDTAITRLDFPFPEYRPGQRELAVAAYRTIRDDGQLLIQAATGIGKTMATIFPAVKALPEGGYDKIFYLTARTTGRMAAEKAMTELRSAGLVMKSLTLTAKDKICFEKERDCTPDECDFARGHFDRINAAVDDLFEHPAFTRQAIEATARVHCVCPFEMSLEMSLLSDCIICDYNYVFDPRVFLRRFFDETPARHIFLIDEAHNLVDRSREMFSADLIKNDILEVRRQLREPLPEIYRQLGKINRWFLETRKLCDREAQEKPEEKLEGLLGSKTGTRNDPQNNKTDVLISPRPNSAGQGYAMAKSGPPDGIYPLLRHFLRQTDRWLAKNINTDFRKPMLELYFKIAGFMRIADLYGDNFATSYESDGRNLKLKLFCIDPARHLHQCLERCSTSVFFSATMSPMPYFSNLLGCSERARHLNLPSPFPPLNFQVYIADRVSTLYRHREETKLEVAQLLGAFVGRARGNYILYFPSYQYMQMVYALFTEHYAGIETLLQEPEMSENERDSFLSRFDAGNSETLVGFAVMGGIFGEGIDLVGRRLSGAAIVGVGLPAICLERELIRDYFSEAGFDYAYTFPGINRVLQAAGRVIRSEYDRGSLLLIDTRYANYRYKSLLPRHWRTDRIRSIEGLRRTV